MKKGLLLATLVILVLSGIIILFSPAARQSAEQTGTSQTGTLRTRDKKAIFADTGAAVAITDTSDFIDHWPVASHYPGGFPAWRDFLAKNLHYPSKAIDEEIEGTVTVAFKVTEEGVPADVHVVSGPEKGGLREEAVRVIAHSGKWIPASDEGRPAKSYAMQPIVFHLEQD